MNTVSNPLAQNWSQRLNEAYNGREGVCQRSVRLPASGPMTVSGEGRSVTITLRADTVVRNMQENSAAFEGWSLALRRWCEVEKVTLQWDFPGCCEFGELQKRHYQRFLYRVAQFQSLFPEWFVGGQPELLPQSQILSGSELFLNVAGDRSSDMSEPVHVAGSRAKRRPEYELEMKLLGSGDFLRHYGLSDKSIVDRQFPVGLFSSSDPTKASQIFPGGKGAIDLVCLDENVFWLFELKAAFNLSVGTVAELIFYTSMIRDAVGRRFRFARGKASKISSEKIAGVTKIVAVMLGHNLHPLLADPGVMTLLNDAAGRHWNECRGFPQVSFRASEIECDDPLKIRDVR